MLKASGPKPTMLLAQNGPSNADGTDQILIRHQILRMLIKVNSSNSKASKKRTLTELTFYHLEKHVAHPNIL